MLIGVPLVNVMVVVMTVITVVMMMVVMVKVVMVVTTVVVVVTVNGDDVGDQEINYYPEHPGWRQLLSSGACCGCRGTLGIQNGCTCKSLLCSCS